MRLFDIRDDHEDQLNFIASDCRNFHRRGDFNAFNMVHYHTCENCDHFTADLTCDYGKSSYNRPFDMI